MTDNNLVKSFYWVAGRIYGDMRFGYDTVPVSKIEAIAETNLANVTASTCTSLSYPQPPPSAPWVPISDGAIVCVKTLAGGYAAVQQIWHYAPAQYTDRAALRIKHLVDPPPPPAPPQPTGDLTFSSSEGYDWNEGEVIHPLTTLDQIRTTFTWWPGGNLGDGRIYGDIYFNDDSGVVASRLAVSAEPDLDSMTAADCMQADKYMVSVDDGDIVCVKRAQGGYAALKMISHTSLAGGDLVDSGTIRIKILE